MDLEKSCDSQNFALILFHVSDGCIGICIHSENGINSIWMVSDWNACIHNNQHHMLFVSDLVWNLNFINQCCAAGADWLPIECTRKYQISIRCNSDNTRTMHTRKCMWNSISEDLFIPNARNPQCARSPIIVARLISTKIHFSILSIPPHSSLARNDCFFFLPTCWSHGFLLFCCSLDVYSFSVVVVLCLPFFLPSMSRALEPNSILLRAKCVSHIIAQSQRKIKVRVWHPKMWSNSAEMYTFLQLKSQVTILVLAHEKLCHITRNNKIREFAFSWCRTTTASIQN